jgi:hypothetical protein
MRLAVERLAWPLHARAVDQQDSDFIDAVHNLGVGNRHAEALGELGSGMRSVGSMAATVPIAAGDLVAVTRRCAVVARGFPTSRASSSRCFPPSAAGADENIGDRTVKR